MIAPVVLHIRYLKYVGKSTSKKNVLAEIIFIHDVPGALCHGNICWLRYRKFLIYDCYQKPALSTCTPVEKKNEIVFNFTAQRNFAIPYHLFELRCTARLFSGVSRKYFIF